MSISWRSTSGPAPRFDGADYDEATQRWTARLTRDGAPRTLRPKHIVLATSVSGTPNIPDIDGIENFEGPVLHSSRFAAGKQWTGRPVVVFGTGTSAHDICQELQAAGADVTMVQRSPTMVVNVEPAQLYDKTYLGDGPPIAIRDILNSGVPLPVMKVAHKIITDEVKRLDAPLLSRLERVGFRLEFGEDGTGWPLKFRTRGGGYYFNVGASELIADGKIKLVQAADIAGYRARRAQLQGRHARCKVDLIVLATGYKGPDHLLTQLFGAQVAKRVGRVWGFDDASSGTAQHVDPHAAAGAVVRRRRVLAGPHLQPLRRGADRRRSRPGNWPSRCDFFFSLSRSCGVTLPMLREPPPAARFARVDLPASGRGKQGRNCDSDCPINCPANGLGEFPRRP